MKRALLIAAGVLAVLLLVAARPGSEFGMMQMLNGQPVRWTLPDGGESGLYAASGKACASLSGSSAQVVMVVPELPLNLCIRPNGGETAAWGTNNWDGGCNTITGDPSFGVPLQPWVPFYAVLDPAATAICASSDAGTVQAGIWRMY